MQLYAGLARRAKTRLTGPCTISSMSETPDASHDPLLQAQDKLSRPRKLAVFGTYSDHDLYQRNRTLVSLLKELSIASVEIYP